MHAPSSGVLPASAQLLSSSAPSSFANAWPAWPGAWPDSSEIIRADAETYRELPPTERRLTMLVTFCTERSHPRMPAGYGAMSRNGIAEARLGASTCGLGHYLAHYDERTSDELLKHETCLAVTLARLPGNRGKWGKRREGMTILLRSDRRPTPLPRLERSRNAGKTRI